MPTQDQLLLKQTPATFRGVLGAKVSGLLAMAPHLHAAPISAVALFSSVSSIVAPLGQPNYAAANAMLNAWANAQSAQACSQQSPALPFHIMQPRMLQPTIRLLLITLCCRNFTRRHWSSSVIATHPSIYLTTLCRC